MEIQLLGLPNLFINIGKTSDNDLFKVDLKDLPHLFLSYGEEKQMYQFYYHMIAGINETDPDSDLIFACALSTETFKNLEKTFKPQSLKYLFITNDPEQGEIGSKYIFWQELMKENKKRQRKRMGAKQIIFPPLVVIIDDLLGLVITKRKYTGLYFLQLLTEGPGAGIHFVVTSSRAYRNIMNQLLTVDPGVKNSLRKQMPGKDISFDLPLGAELVITAEELYFFKERTMGDYRRYFPERDLGKGLV